MLKRDTPRIIPDREPYYAITIPGRPDELFHFRLPTGDTMRHFARYMRANARGRATEGIGAIVGLAWRHLHLDIEVEQPEGRPDRWTDEQIDIYGHAVHEELHEEGFTRPQLDVMLAGAYHHLRERSKVSQEVRKKLDFFGASTEGGSEPPSSVSVSSSEDESAPLPD